VIQYSILGNIEGGMKVNYHSSWLYPPTASVRIGKHLPTTQRRENKRDVRNVYTLARLVDEGRGAGAKYDEGCFLLPVASVQMKYSNFLFLRIGSYTVCS
jgi:hypothetical protein